MRGFEMAQENLRNEGKNGLPGRDEPGDKGADGAEERTGGGVGGI